MILGPTRTPAKGLAVTSNEPQGKTTVRQEMIWLPDHPRSRLLLIIGVSIVVAVAAIGALADVASLAVPVLLPAAIALLLTGLLMPIQVLLNVRLGLHRYVGALLTVLTALAVVAATVYFAGAELVAGVSEVLAAASLELEQIERWITESPIPLNADQVSELIDQARAWLADNQARLAQEAVGAGYGLASGLFSLFLVVFSTFFLLAQGDRIAAWLIMLAPRSWRERAFEAGRRGWVTLATYTKMQVVIAAVDAVGIGIGALILGLPFVIPLVALTFLLCFVPVLGALISGTLFVLVALAFQGPLTAAIMLAVVIGVQQLESDVLSPMLMGKAVKVHPIAILLGVSAGTYLIGIPGALFAVPFIAVVNVMANYLAGRDPFPVLDEGGSALTDSVGKLAGDVSDPEIPKKLGQATPRWWSSERAEAHRHPKPADETADDEAHTA